MKKQEIAVWQVFIRRFSKNFALFALWFRLNPLPKEFATTVQYSVHYRKQGGTIAVVKLYNL